MSTLPMGVQALATRFSNFAKLERIIALVCILIPALLYWVDDISAFRDSISDYVYMNPNSHVFGMLLTMAAMMFIFNGALYMQKSADFKNTQKRGRWYNIVLGLALLGVALLPCKDYVIAHYICAGIFFIGSAFAIAFLNDRQYRKTSYVIAAISVLSLAFHFWMPDVLSLLFAEWISLTVIAVHYILESLEGSAA